MEADFFEQSQSQAIYELVRSCIESNCGELKEGTWYSPQVYELAYCLIVASSRFPCAVKLVREIHDAAQNAKVGDQDEYALKTLEQLKSQAAAIASALPPEA